MVICDNGSIFNMWVLFYSVFFWGANSQQGMSFKMCLSFTNCKFVLSR